MNNMEISFKKAMRDHCTPIRIAEIKQSDNAKNLGMQKNSKSYKLPTE